MPTVFLPQIIPPPVSGSPDQKIADVVRQINSAFALLPWSTLLGLGDKSGGLQFTKSLSMSDHKITDLATAVGDNDAVALGQMEDFVTESLNAQLSSSSFTEIIRRTEIEIATRATTATNAEKLNGKVLLTATATVDIPVIGGGTTANFTVPILGAIPTDPVFLAAPAALEADVIFCGYVCSNDTVCVRVYSPGVADPISATWGVAVLH